MQYSKYSALRPAIGRHQCVKRSKRSCLYTYVISSIYLTAEFHLVDDLSSYCGYTLTLLLSVCNDYTYTYTPERESSPSCHQQQNGTLESAIKLQDITGLNRIIINLIVIVMNCMTLRTTGSPLPSLNVWSFHRGGDGVTSGEISWRSCSLGG